MFAVRSQLSLPLRTGASVARAPAFGAGSHTGFLGSIPPSRIRSFAGPEDTLKAMARLALGDRGEKSQVVRRFLEWVIRDIWPKDYLGEILACRNIFLQKSPTRPGMLFRYMNDPRHVEWIKDPQRQVEEIEQSGSTVIDCDEIACMIATMGLQLGREVEFVALGFAPGQLTHVGARVKEPKSDTWIWCDAVAGPREREAALTAKEILFHSLD